MPVTNCFHTWKENNSNKKRNFGHAGYKKQCLWPLHIDNAASKPRTEWCTFLTRSAFKTAQCVQALSRNVCRFTADSVATERPAVLAVSVVKRAWWMQLKVGLHFNIPLASCPLQVDCAMTERWKSWLLQLGLQGEKASSKTHTVKHWKPVSCHAASTEIPLTNHWTIFLLYSCHGAWHRHEGYRWHFFMFFTRF